jgi:hypothetical protein
MRFKGVNKARKRNDKAIHAFADTKRDFLINTNQQPFATHL